MAYFKLSLLTLSIPVGKTRDGFDIEYFSNTISEYSSQDQSKNFCYSYNEQFSIHTNAQKELTFSMDRMLMKGDEWIENPFVKHIHNGSQLLLEDKYGKQHLFTVVNIGFNIKEINITYNVTCRDSFSYQLSRQNDGFTIENDPSSADYIGAKTIDEWTQNYIIPECYIQSYKYIPLNRGLYLSTKGETLMYDEKDSLSDVQKIIRAPYNKTLHSEYFEAYPFSLSGGTANSALIAAAEEVGMMIEVYEYLIPNTQHIEKYFWFSPQKNEQNNGLVYSPYTSVGTFDFSHSGESLTTILNVEGNDSGNELITLFPPVSPFFSLLFNSESWQTTTYYPGMFKDICQGKTYVLSDEDADNALIKLTFEYDREGDDYITILIQNRDNPYFITSPFYKYVSFTNELFHSEITYKDKNNRLYTLDSRYDKWEIAFEDDETYEIIYDGQEIDSKFLGKVLNNCRIRVPITLVGDAGLDDEEGGVIDYNIWINFSRDVSQDDLEFAEAADRCPWLENKLIDFRYFLEHKILTSKEYDFLINYICNNLRILNGQILLAQSQYAAALQERTTILADLTNSIDSIGAAANAVFITPYQEDGQISTNTSYFDNAYNALFGTNINLLNRTPLLDYETSLANYFDKMFWTEQRLFKNLYNFREYFNAPFTSNDQITLYQYNIVLDEPTEKHSLIFCGDGYTEIVGETLTADYQTQVDDNAKPLTTWYVNFSADDQEYKFQPTIVNKQNYTEFYQITDDNQFKQCGHNSDIKNTTYAPWKQFYRPTYKITEIVDRSAEEVISQLEESNYPIVRLQYGNEHPLFKTKVIDQEIFLIPCNPLISYPQEWFKQQTINEMDIEYCRKDDTHKTLCIATLTRVMQKASEKDILQDYLLRHPDVLFQCYYQDRGWKLGSSENSIYVPVTYIAWRDETNNINHEKDELFGATLETTLVNREEYNEESYYKYLPITELYYYGYKYRTLDYDTYKTLSRQELDKWFTPISNIKEIITVPFVTPSNESSFYRQVLNPIAFLFAKVLNIYDKPLKKEGWSTTDITGEEVGAWWSHYREGSKALSYTLSPSAYQMAQEIITKNNDYLYTQSLKDFYYFNSFAHTTTSARADFATPEKDVEKEKSILYYPHKNKLRFKDTFFRLFTPSDRPNKEDNYYLYAFEDTIEARNALKNALSSTRYIYNNDSYDAGTRNQYRHLSLVRHYSWLNGLIPLKNTSEYYENFEEWLANHENLQAVEWNLTDLNELFFPCSIDSKKLIIIIGRKEDYVYRFLNKNSDVNVYSTTYYNFETNAKINFTGEQDYVEGFFVDGAIFGGIQPATTFDESGVYYQRIGDSYERVYTAYQLLTQKPLGSVYITQSNYKAYSSFTPVDSISIPCQLITYTSDNYYNTVVFETTDMISNRSVSWDWINESNQLISKLRLLSEVKEGDKKWVYTLQVLDSISTLCTSWENTEIVCGTWKFSTTDASDVDRIITTVQTDKIDLEFNTEEDDLHQLVVQNKYKCSYESSCRQQSYERMTNGAFWYYFTNAHFVKDKNDWSHAELFRKAAEIEHQLTVYWQAAYNASLYSNYFIPQYWQNRIEGNINHFFSDIMRIDIDSADGVHTTTVSAILNDKFIPKIEIFKHNGNTRLPYYQFTSAAQTTSGQSMNKLNYFQPLHSLLKTTFNSQTPNALTRSVVAQELGIQQTYYTLVSGGTTWAQAFSEWALGTKYSEYSGIYPLMIKTLLNKYSAMPKLQYEALIARQQKEWAFLNDLFPTILLESKYSNTSASNAADLYLLASNAFKDLSYPERAYNISLIDYTSLKGYQGGELNIGDSILLNADEYYDQEDDIKRSLAQFLYITDINYVLRNDSEISITVNAIKHQDKLIKRLAKLIRL